MYYTAMVSDKWFLAEVKKDKKLALQADEEMGLLTPIAKGFLTEIGFEMSNLGMQCWGGHGYIAENGLEQNARDCRISMMYEGTTAVQALDLLGRKIMLQKGKNLQKFTKEILGYCKDAAFSSPVSSQLMPYAGQLALLTLKWGYVSGRLLVKAASNKEIVGSAAVDFLMFSGYVCLAYMWLRQMEAAAKKLQKKEPGFEYYEAKFQTGEFYYNYMLKRTHSHYEAMLTDPKYMMQMKAENFSLHL